MEKTTDNDFDVEVESDESDNYYFQLLQSSVKFAYNILNIF